MSVKTRDLAFLGDHLNYLKNGDFSKEYKVKPNPLGEGSFGTVFIALHLLTKEERAVKRINKDRFTVSQMQLLNSEMSVLKQLSHPNILRLIEYFDSKDYLYVVTELYRGGELFDAIIEQQECSEQDTVKVMRQLFSCIAFCNSRNIIHRDIKPENIMLEKKGDLSQVKLIDFGYAAHFDISADDPTKGNARTLLTDKFGTPYYVAPEVLKKRYNHKCDVWSLGCVAYSMLSGEPAFPGDSISEIFNLILETENKDVQFVGHDYDPTEDENDIWTNVSTMAKDFIRICLTFNFDARPSAQDLLTHPFLNANKGNTKNVLISGVGKRAVANLEKFKSRQRLAHLIYSYLISQYLPNEKREEFAEIFQKWDTNGNGTLSKEEIRMGIQEINKYLIPAIDIDSLFGNIDVDGSGEIDYREFLLAVVDEQSVMTIANLSALFDLLDTDKNGKLSTEELKALLEQEGESKPIDAIVRKMIEEVDIDKDGEISKDEFLTLACL